MERLAPIFNRLRPDVIHDIAVTATPRPDTLALPTGLGAIHYLARKDTEASQSSLVFWLARNGHRYRAVHYHTHVDRTFAASLWLRLSGIRVLLSSTLSDSVPGILQTYRPIWRPLVRRLMATIERYIAISTKLFNENSQHVPCSKSELLPIGIPIPKDCASARQSSRKKLNLAPDDEVLISVGGICQRKDQLFLVCQMPALLHKHPRLRLILAGPILDIAYKSKIDDVIATEGLGNHVRFAGYTETPSDFYDAADIMVFASREEGFGTVVIEAMACRLPVIARHLPGVNDMFIEPGISGYLFSQANDFHRYADTLLASSTLRARMGSAGRAFVAAHFDISVIAARYLALYGFPAQSARP
ncbi:MAG TPA: glycosyltransferase family 4 protein [Rhizomicrobium sp.]